MGITLLKTQKMLIYIRKYVNFFTKVFTSEEIYIIIMYDELFASSGMA